MYMMELNSVEVAGPEYSGARELTSPTTKSMTEFLWEFNYDGNGIHISKYYTISMILGIGMLIGFILGRIQRGSCCRNRRVADVHQPGSGNFSSPRISPSSFYSRSEGRKPRSLKRCPRVQDFPHKSDKDSKYTKEVQNFSPFKLELRQAPFFTGIQKSENGQLPGIHGIPRTQTHLVQPGSAENEAYWIVG